MEMKIAVLISNAAADECLDVGIHENYSGRGMMGEKTTALEYTHMPALLIAVAIAVSKAEEPSELIDALWGLRTDSLGKNLIVY